MKVFIAKIDYFDPCRWPVLSAPYKRDPESGRENIIMSHTSSARTVWQSFVGSQSGANQASPQEKALGMISCHMALYETRAVVDPELVASAHFTRRDGDFRMPYCIPFSSLWGVSHHSRMRCWPAKTNLLARIDVPSLSSFHARKDKKRPT